MRIAASGMAPGRPGVVAVYHPWAPASHLRRKRRARLQTRLGRQRRRKVRQAGPPAGLVRLNPRVGLPDEKTLYIANEFSYRFGKVVLQ